MRWGELLAANLSCQRIAVTANIRPIDTAMGSTPFEARIDFLSTRPLRIHNSGRGSRVEQDLKRDCCAAAKGKCQAPGAPLESPSQKSESTSGEGGSRRGLGSLIRATT